MEELKLDIAEVEKLLAQATRPKVKDALSLHLRKVQSELILLREASEGQADAKPVSQIKTTVKVTRPLENMTTYAWDQSPKFMKIYVTLPGVQDISAESVKSQCTERSFKLRIENLNNKDYQVHVAYLFDKIIPEKCYHKVKTDMVILFLKKKEEKTWAYVTEQEGVMKKKKDAKKPDMSANPDNAMMDMMKQMYEDGDDDMKRTIAKAWTESQDKKMQGGGAAGLDDM